MNKLVEPRGQQGDVTDVGKLLFYRSRPGRIASGSLEGRPHASFGCGVCSAAMFGRHRGLPLCEEMCLAVGVAAPARWGNPRADVLCDFLSEWCSEIALARNLLRSITDTSQIRRVTWIFLFCGTSVFNVAAKK